MSRTRGRLFGLNLPPAPGVSGRRNAGETPGLALASRLADVPDLAEQPYAAESRATELGRTTLEFHSLAPPKRAANWDFV